MNKTSLIAAALVSAFLLSGCETTNGGNRTKTVIGGAGGAAAGGLLGTTLGGGDAKAIAAGTILGLLTGGFIGDRLDAADRKYAAQSTHQVLEYERVGKPVSWQNQQNGSYGQVIATRSYQNSNGRYCREYQQSIVVGGEAQRAHGTACRQSDGTWEIQ